MIKIIKANANHAETLSLIGRQTFLESHGMSASKAEIDSYINLKFTKSAFEAELLDTNTIFHILIYNETPIGYSKIIYSISEKNIPFKNVTKLERIYVLKAFHNLKL